ncbi:hypothetical protein B0H17DRAFT_1095457 [Mycena rosella]|uniref:IBR domain-containing protein n=1 Tax=Mycena rosella TaxID=1033263 RepID=A0AAD7CRQ3_MYCRO|nr:hypothetical protein B0H17DRAFT_1095457 [Mycena rosella]
MFKKYKAFLNNEGQFEQPGARALQDFINVYNQQLEAERLAQTVRAAEKRVQMAEQQAREAEERADRAERPSAEEVTRERLFPETILSEAGAAAEPPKPDSRPGSKTCAICSGVCHICPNPWQRTRSDRMVSKVPTTVVSYGTMLWPCNHVFCGACLAQTIYHSLNMAFDPTTYGTVLPRYDSDTPGIGPAEFPISCPRCPVKPGGKFLEIGDTAARLVLGEPNMEEWKYARFLSLLNIIYCPHKGCNEAFDANEAATSPGADHAPTRVECPRCRNSLCRACKSVWHENLTCLMYQASPISESFPESAIPKPGWDARVQQQPQMYSPGASSPYSPELYSQGESPWGREEQNILAH